MVANQKLLYSAFIMSEKGSVYQKGGGGTNFEQYVQCAFLTTLIVQGNVPCIPNGKLVEVAFQTTSRGYETDDLLAIVKSDFGEHKLIAQIKHNLVFSDSDSNSTFKEVITGFWKDFNNTSIFDRNKDMLLIIKSGLNNQERNHVKSLLNWAKNHHDADSFYKEVNRIKEKKNYLEIFRSVVKQANSGNTITDDELWQFLKCVDVLDYDFQNQGSVDETYFINLIRLSKSNTSTINENEIWNTIYSIVAKYNPDGGSITIDSIKEQDVYKYFDIQKLNPISKSIVKLQSDSSLILSPLKNTVDGLHIERLELCSGIYNTINSNPITIITGNPGVGKSAIIKDVLNINYSNANVFVFRADQFNESHLSHVFSNEGILESIQDIISYMALVPEKLIIIDSLEKLLEGDPENAFKQLLEILSRNSDIKIVATSRKYAIDLIIQKFGISNNRYNSIEVPELNDDEFKIILDKFPQLISINTSPRLNRFLRVPKYLDFIIESLRKDSSDYSALTTTDFKKKLWSNIIENITVRQNGIDRKRNDAFLNVAIKRAKRMKLFVEPDSGFEDGVEALERDNVIFRDGIDYKFSPTHDILEDWALVKYVENKYDEYGTSKTFFDNLGNEPSFRRAFRLWIEESLYENNQKVDALITLTINNTTIEKYWADELLVAIFKSDECQSFFIDFEGTLLENEGVFLNRCIHLIRTACKESNKFDSLLPVGAGWREIIFFISRNINQLDRYRFSIINLLNDWDLDFVLKRNKSEDECIAVKKIILYYISQIESSDEFWMDDMGRKKADELIFMLFNLSKVSHTEITNLINKSLQWKERDSESDWRLNSFYKNVINKCLSGTETFILAEELPDLIINAAWHKWKLKKKNDDSENGYLPHFRSQSRLSPEECWGIRDRFDFFPSGVYKTPIYNLLRCHPIKALKFITEFINYSVDFYLKADGEYKHELKQIEVELNDGTIVKQWGTAELWLAYRGTSVTHDLLSSILMSLEKYLFEMSSKKTDISKENLKFVFDYLLRNSNNIFITSVLSSVTIAYPKEVGNAMLPLLSVMDFYFWDRERSLHENSVLAPIDRKIPFAQKERYESNQLPHRRAYMRGLGDFIIDYQFKIGILNKEIHQVFDKLKKKIDSNDVIANKTITEIDIRNFKVGEYDEKLKGYYIQPKYDEKVTVFIDSGKKEFENQNLSLSNSHIIWQTIDGKVEMDYDTWLSFYNYYIDQTNYIPFYDRHVSLAVLGLKLFRDKLNEQQKEWCIKKIIETNAIILQDTIQRNHNLNMSYNLMEKEIALHSLHLVFDDLESENDKCSIIEMMIRFFSSLSGHELEKFVKYIKDTFSVSLPDCTKKIWIGLVKYAQYKKSNPRIYRYGQNADEIKAAEQKEDEFITLISSTYDFNLQIEEITFDDYDAQILSYALVITPYNVNNTFENYIKRIVFLISEDFKKEENHSYQIGSKYRQIDYETRGMIEWYLSDLLLNAELSYSKQILEQLLTPISNHPPVLFRGKNDYTDYLEVILNYVMCVLYDNGNIQPEPNNYKQQVDNFWKLWEYFFTLIENSSEKPLISKLLLENRYLMFDSTGKVYEETWKALNGRFKFYEKIAKSLGYNYIMSILNVLSTIGRKEFLPNGLSLLRELIEKNPSGLSCLATSSSERLIKELFYNHIQKIKSEKILIDDYVWILNNMIDLGSSESYRFRENVITYKNNN